MLTHFQEIVGMALDIPDADAAKVQKTWPETEELLRKALRQWKAIKGYELLSICGEIWRHKPADLAEIQGRDILYHPVDGEPISEGAPLDGLPWEMLAFLRWALVAHHLQWTDEILIVREIKSAEGGLIDNLPADRFYAKRMLPRTTDGTIDWSDLTLAQAKTMVISGEASSISLPERTMPIYHDETSLAGVLASISSLGDSHARNLLLRGLPRTVCGDIGRTSAPSTDLYNIVEAVEGFGRLADGRIAINVVIDNAMKYVRSTTKVHQLAMFYVEEK